MNQLLTSDHRELDVLLEQLYSALDSEVSTDIFERLDIFWARLAMHIRAEHLRLFPAVLAAAHSSSDPSVSEDSIKLTLSQLQREHDFFIRELAYAIRLSRDLVVAKKRPKQTVANIRRIVVGVNELLESHNMVEESQVYVIAEELIPKSAKKEITASIQNELNFLPPRFENDRTGSQPRDYD